MSTTTRERTSDSAPEEDVRPEDERRPFLSSLGNGVQHILAMVGGVIAGPLILGGAAGLSAPDKALLVSSDLFVSGLATMLQTWASRSSERSCRSSRESRSRRCRRCSPSSASRRASPASRASSVR
ncbi:MAG: solute carrier family 23 protein [Actinomycetales bacterium]